MADAPDLGSGSERIGGSSPLARTTFCKRFGVFSIFPDSFLTDSGHENDRVFPFEVKRGSASVKIYCTPSHGCNSYILTYGRDGVRKRSAFPSFEKAKDEADAVVQRPGDADGYAWPSSRPGSKRRCRRAWLAGWCRWPAVVHLRVINCGHECRGEISCAGKIVSRARRPLAAFSASLV
jgi:hypothetical protein